MNFQSAAFVITPDELENALLPFTLFINNAHVPVNYSFTPKSVFLNNYSELYNIKSEKDQDSYNDYMLFREYLKKHTSDFYFSLNGIKKKTSIRISKEVKAIISNFDCVKKNNLAVL